MPSSSANKPTSSAGNPVMKGEILSALSYALDITEGARPGHSLRCCVLGMRLGKQIGLSEEALSDLYYALLLKDIGCSGNSARMAAAFAADDQTVKQNFKFVDREKLGKPNREALAFVWNNVAPSADVFTRLRQAYRMIRSPGDLTAEMINARCERGAAILFKLGMSIDTCAAVYTLDEHWNGLGLPDHLVAQDIPLLGRICAVAQHLDLFCGEGSMASAIVTLGERSGTWYDPNLVRAAESLYRQGALWTHCLPNTAPADLQSTAVSLAPPSSTALTGYDIDLICSGFADVIDAKSPFTHRHSAGTAEIAVLMGNAMGLAPGRVDVLRRAALLHDIGMLSIPNTILDKPSPLTAREWATVQHHPLLSQQILSRVSAFGEIAVLAGQHHEKLDGSGYPFHLCGEQLSMESRILTMADVFTAMMERRPYRQELNPLQIQHLLARDVPSRLDSECFEATLSVLEQLAILPLEDIPAMSANAIPELVMVEPPPFHFESTSR